MSTLLRVRDLRAWFGPEGDEVRAVDGVDLEIAEGESVGLVGESGCGKTVTALALMGLVPEPGRIVESSSIRFRGEELVGAGSSRLRSLRGSGVAMVFQEPSTALNPVLTVGEQVAEVVRTHGGAGRAAARGRALELLAEVGLPDPARRADDFPHQLSGGMRQRVVIACALAGEPSLLVADEPTTALDVTIQAQILELLADLRERRRMALLLITHDLAVVAEVCERVLVMYAGQIVERADAAEIFRRPVHPYTEALLDSLPGSIAAGAASGVGGRLRPVPGTVPDPRAWPSGCRFADRCRHAWARCHAQHPPLLDVEAGEGEEGEGVEGHREVEGGKVEEGEGVEGHREVEAGEVEEGEGVEGHREVEAGKVEERREMERRGEVREGGDVEGRTARCWLVEEPHRRRGEA